MLKINSCDYVQMYAHTIKQMKVLGVYMKNSFLTIVLCLFTAIVSCDKSLDAPRQDEESSSTIESSEEPVSTTNSSDSQNASLPPTSSDEEHSSALESSSNAHVDNATLSSSSESSDTYSESSETEDSSTMSVSSSSSEEVIVVEEPYGKDYSAICDFQYISDFPNIEDKINALLRCMTLDEKVGQMAQVRHFDGDIQNDIKTYGIGSVIHTQGPLPGTDAQGWQALFKTLQERALETRLSIPLLFAADAIHGQNTFEGATIFPHNIGLGATNNPAIVKEAARITALESRATGINWVFSPCIAIPYSEKWGRVYEGFSESTDMTTQMAIASIEGHQGPDLKSNDKVIATAKHFVGDGATDNGDDSGYATMTRADLSERLLPPYRAAVESGVGAVMASFSHYGDIVMHAHKELLTDTLKIGMGFDGIVVSDWQGYKRLGKNDIINAGVDVAMAVDGDLVPFLDEVKYAAPARIDDAVRRILRQKLRLGLFKKPFPDPSLIPFIGSKEHRDVARDAVRQSLVLLKHENSVLPISKSTGKIVVVGEHADNSGLHSGGWTVNWQGTNQSYAGSTTILQGIQAQAQGNVVYDWNATGNHLDADVAIVVVGEGLYAEAKGDHWSVGGEFPLQLSDQHKNYINAYADKIPTIVILSSGRPLVVTDQINQSDAFVAAWLLGSEGGGVAEVLFGDYNFTGKLPHSWPKAMSDLDGLYGPNFWDPNAHPLFPYGHGLTY